MVPFWLRDVLKHVPGQEKQKKLKKILKTVEYHKNYAIMHSLLIFGKMFECGKNFKGTLSTRSDPELNMSSQSEEHTNRFLLSYILFI
jgi:hypothetical protein